MASLPFSAMYAKAARAASPTIKQGIVPAYNSLKTGGGKIGAVLNHPVTEQIGGVAKQAAGSFHRAALKGTLDKPYKNVVRAVKVGAMLHVVNNMQRNLSQNQFNNNQSNQFRSF